MDSELTLLMDDILQHTFEELKKLRDDKVDKLNSSIREEQELGKKGLLQEEKKQLFNNFLQQVTDYIKNKLTEQQMKDIFTVFLAWNDELENLYSAKYRSYSIEHDTLYYVLQGLSSAIEDKDFLSAASENYFKRIDDVGLDEMVDVETGYFSSMNFYKSLLLLSLCKDTNLKNDYIEKRLISKGFVPQFVNSPVFNDTILLEAVKKGLASCKEKKDNGNTAFLLLKELLENKNIPFHSKETFMDFFAEYFPENYDFWKLDFFSASINDYDSAMKLILEKNLDKKSLESVLCRCKIKAEDLIKLYNDERIISRLPQNSLSVILNTDGETKYQILFHSLLTKHAIEKNLMHEAIREADDDLIYSMLSHADSLNYILQDQVFRNEFIEKYFNSSMNHKPLTNAKIWELFKDVLTPQQMSSLFLPGQMPYDVQLQYYLDEKYCYRILDVYHPEYNPSGDQNKISDIKKAQSLIYRLYNDNHFLFKSFNPGIMTDELFQFDYKFIALISKYPEVQQSIIEKLKIDKYISQVGVRMDWENDPVEYQKVLRMFNLDEDHVATCKPIDGRICGKVLMNMLKVIDGIDPECVIPYVSDLAKITVMEHTSNNIFNDIFLKDGATSFEKFVVNVCQGLDVSTITPNQWRTLTKIFLHDIPFSDKNYYISVDIHSLQDIDTYDERRRQKLDDLFNQALHNREVNQAINIFLNKYYDIDIDTARKMIETYGMDIDSIKEDKYQKSIDFIKQLKRVLSIKSLQELQQLYQSETELSFEDGFLIKNAFPKIFGHTLSNQLTSFSAMKPVDNGQFNFPSSVKVYEAPDDFIFLVHSTDAYGKLEIIDGDYKKSWNESDRTNNHGICCSLIANDYLGMAEIKDVLLGFNDISDSSLVMSAPYDLYTQNNQINIQAGRKVKFFSPRNIINYTRYAHNEQSIERRELRNELVDKGIVNLQPSYVIVFSDMSASLRQKAIKCAEDFGIPIVYIDRQKVVQNEANRIDAMIRECYATVDISRKIELFSDIYLKHENNRCGLLNSDASLQSAFSTSKIENLLNDIINQMIAEKNKTHDYQRYGDSVLKLVEVLQREESKFITSYETKKRTVENDITASTYIRKMYEEIDEQIYRENRSKLATVTATVPLDDSLLSQELHTANISAIVSEIHKFNSQLTFSFGSEALDHIERTTVLAGIIGKKEMPNDAHAQCLLRLSAELRDCGKKSNLPRYASESASDAEQILGDELKVGNISQDDLHIIQFAIEYQDLDSYRFDDRLQALFQKYGIDADHFEYAEKIAQCLKDANELECLRMTQSLNEQRFVTEVSHELIPVARELLERYKSYAQIRFIDRVKERSREQAEHRELFRQSELKYKMKSGFERMVARLKDIVVHRTAESKNVPEGDNNEIRRR